MLTHLEEGIAVKEVVLSVANLEQGSLLQESQHLLNDFQKIPAYWVQESSDLLTDETLQPRKVEAHLTEGVAAPQSVLVAVVLGYTDIPGALFEIEGRLHNVPVVLHSQLSSAGGDGHCEGVDDESLALPQVDLSTMHFLGLC